MSERTWLLVDSNNLCRRAQYTTGHLKNGTVYGFLRQILALRKQFPGARFVFAWDHGWQTKRRELFGAYKQNRRIDQSAKPLKEEKEFRAQVWALKQEHLPALGFVNSFWEEGYEADDVIVSVAENSLGPAEVFVTVSDDKDLFGLLRHVRASQWLPSRKIRYSMGDFREDYQGLAPEQWAQVKAIAGCKSDNVPGVPGVGEATAIRFLQGKLNEGSPTFIKIVEYEPIWKRNLQLVRLPFPGCPKFELREDKATPEKWKALSERLGLKGLDWFETKPVRSPRGLF